VHYTSGAAATVAILMATFQGRAFLEPQLQSFVGQTYPHWTLLASDDGSTDGTAQILEHYRQSWGDSRLSVSRGPSRGLNANFRTLIATAPAASAYAFSDQDDEWETGKLERAVRWLETVAPERPALYCSRTTLIDDGGRRVGQSPLHRRPPSFANALVQNIAGGNTMVFNPVALQLLRDVLPVSGDVIIYDWWAYLIVTGVGGAVYYDAEPGVRYRQHGRNVVGANAAWRDRLGNIRHVVRGRLREWNDRHLRALDRVRDKLTEENVSMLDTFAAARQQHLVARLAGLRRAGVYRQTATGNLGIVLAALFNRV